MGRWHESKQLFVGDARLDVDQVSEPRYITICFAESECVHAVSANIDGPFQKREVAVSLLPKSRPMFIALAFPFPQMLFPACY